MDMWNDLISQYGYIAIFFLLTLGVIGLPIPDEVLMTYLGYITSTGKMSYLLTVLFGVAGSIVGITISYILGIKLGEPFIRKYGPKFFIKEKAVKRTKLLFHKHGAYMLFACYFIPGVRHVAAYLAGITGYKYRPFALFAYSGAVVWVLVFVTLGNRLGSHWEIIFSFISRYTKIMLIILGIGAIIAILYYFFFKRMKSST
ncbi:DedA family protein [Ornithinibacillus bavariensis]|uniref:Alkaline phosphatase n=1 Tax=Ornithinibacillus bavariensis TaxID=545502 RepID=A0A919X841_9BACI|nr:DedA family protein [Ornithinibacillus bavariensis]GIO27544.1 alkaline phosphatase [Ornithinibacillus bavariensis]